MLSKGLVKVKDKALRFAHKTILRPFGSETIMFEKQIQLIPFSSASG